MIAPDFKRRLISLAVMAAAAPGAQAITHTWITGNYAPGVTAPEPMPFGDVLDINSGGSKIFNGVTFTSNGTVNWNADDLFMQSGAVVNNAGVWDAMSDNTLANNGGSLSTFNNTGTFLKSAGAGSTTIGSIAFVNSGILDAQTGTINFSGGNVTFNGGTQFIGAGVNLVGSNATFNNGFTSANLLLSAGTFTGGNAVLNGSVDWTGGTFAGAWTFAAGQTLNGVTGGTKLLNGVALTNQGTIAWQTGDSLFMQSGAALSNEGLFEFQESASIVNNGGTTPTFINTVSGVVNVAAGKTGTIGSVAFVNNGGQLMADAGATLLFNGHNVQFNDGTQFLGAGVNQVAGNATFSGGYSSGNLLLSGGTLSGNAAVAGGTTTMTGGTLTGA